LRGIMPFTARRMTSSGRRSSISPSDRDLMPPGYPLWRKYCFSVRLLPVTVTFSALMTMT
jgi:hypothetical protein